MLSKGVKAKLAEGARAGRADARRLHGGDSHTISILYGGGAPLINSGRALDGGLRRHHRRADGGPALQHRRESRAKIIYERLINVTDDPGVKEALGFLMTREVAHQKSFEKALYAIEPNFPSGKLPGMPEYTDKYYNMSHGTGDTRGPWNEGKEWEFVSDPEKQGPVDGGEGDAMVMLSPSEAALANKEAARTASKTERTRRQVPTSAPAPEPARPSRWAATECGALPWRARGRLHRSLGQPGRAPVPDGAGFRPMRHRPVAAAAAASVEARPRRSLASRGERERRPPPGSAGGRLRRRRSLPDACGR